MRIAEVINHLQVCGARSNTHTYTYIQRTVEPDPGDGNNADATEAEFREVCAARFQTRVIQFMRMRSRRKITLKMNPV